MIKYNPALDSLRALSVILVIFFHFDLFNLTGGFIGVDIFFVISGYLITYIICHSLDKKKFTICDFYIRRARRILPALYITILFSLSIGFFIFGIEHFDRLKTSSLYSILGISNFFFASEYSYFDFNKIFKPLLHTWSLSVEIQFYLLWPFFIWFFYSFLKEKIKYLIILLFFLIFIISLVYSQRSEAFFYFTPFRFYEFLIGSILVFYKFDFKNKLNDLIFIFGIITILFSSFLFTENTNFPAGNALVPCFGACLIIISSNKLILFKNLYINKYSIFLGKISYSIYLFHWPILIFLQYTIINNLNFFLKGFLIVFIFFISYLSYSYIETPFRKKKDKKNYLISNLFFFNSIIISIFLVFLSYKYIDTNYKENNISIEKKKVLIKLIHEQKKRKELENEFKKKSEKNTPFIENKFKVLIFGDSHGLDLAIALEKNIEYSSLDINYYEFTSFNCFRIENTKDKIVEIIKKNLISFSNNCKIDLEKILNDQIFDQTDKIIISSRWTDQVDFNKLLKLNKNFSKDKVIIMGRKPYFYHIPTLFQNVGTDINKHAFLQKDKNVKKINLHIQKESKKYDLYFFDLNKMICNNYNCSVFANNSLLLYDEDHWSEAGSKYFGNQLFINNFLNIIRQ